MSTSPSKHAPTTDAEPLGERRLVSEFTAGGHEIDNPPSATLFGFLIAMAIVIIVSAVGVYQLFVVETEEDRAFIASQPVMLLENQAARDREFFTTYGVLTADGAPAGYRMPIATAKKLVLEDPSRFSPAPPPVGWVHPDDAATP